MFRSLAIRAGLFCLVLAPLATVASAQLKISGSQHTASVA